LLSHRRVIAYCHIVWYFVHCATALYITIFVFIMFLILFVTLMCQKNSETVGFVLSIYLLMCLLCKC